jgi:hypothetical protein
MEVADICCQGRVISVLEGGYGTYLTKFTAKQQSSVNTSAGSHPLDRSIFCESALSHLSALVDPYSHDI